MTSEKETQKSTVEKKEKKKRTGGIAAFSLLISLFDKLGEIIYNTVIEGFFGNIQKLEIIFREAFLELMF